MKILIFGAAGLLGRHLAWEMADMEITALTRQQADITDCGTLDKLFRERWDAVINAAAVCDFDACENDPAGTGRVNRDAPLDLAGRCHASGALFVQFSSDYVFPGTLRRPLTEDDEPAPLSVYGGQKADVERGIPRLCPRSLVVRLSWIYGRGGKTFMSLLPDLLATREVLRVASGKKGCCLYARDAAQWTRRLLESGDTGIVNLVNTGDTSWEEFAHTCLRKMTDAGMTVKCRVIEEIPYETIGPNWDKRPRWSCLDIARLRQLHPPGPRAWTEALDSFLREQKSVAASQAL